MATQDHGQPVHGQLRTYLVQILARLDQGQLAHASRDHNQPILWPGMDTDRIANAYFHVKPSASHVRPNVWTGEPTTYLDHIQPNHSDHTPSPDHTTTNPHNS